MKTDYKEEDYLAPLLSYLTGMFLLGLCAFIGLFTMLFCTPQTSQNNEPNLEQDTTRTQIIDWSKTDNELKRDWLSNVSDY
ncbi:MAG: hypothetical protein N4A41_00460 [Crocinitomicaceae bacterium]|jgi:hypothetical protein|nr:hypothetical protein [Crocinitomicaceae bacterium]